MRADIEQQVIPRLILGLPPAVQAAVVRRVQQAREVSPAARIAAHIDGRSYEVAANTTSSFAFQVDQVAIYQQIRITSDTPREVEFAFSKPTAEGALIGDQQSPVRIDTLELDRPVDLVSPWEFVPNETANVEITNRTGAPVRVNVALFGWYLYQVR
jgi:hypothetical protein